MGKQTPILLTFHTTDNYRGGWPVCHFTTKIVKYRTNEYESTNRANQGVMILPLDER